MIPQLHRSIQGGKHLRYGGRRITTPPAPRDSRETVCVGRTGAGALNHDSCSAGELRPTKPAVCLPQPVGYYIHDTSKKNGTGTYQQSCQCHQKTSLVRRVLQLWIDFERVNQTACDDGNDSPVNAQTNNIHLRPQQHTDIGPL